jgi:D-alanine-D-alanine ligase
VQGVPALPTLQPLGRAFGISFAPFGGEKADSHWERRMNITILTYLEEENAREHEAVVDQVRRALREAGHKATVLGVHGDIGKLIRGVRRRQPDLIFNLLETFGDTQLGLTAVTGLLDLVGIPYTGSGPGEFYLQEDKALAKKLLAYDKIPSPDFAVFSQDADFETGGNLRLPLFVKPLRMDASIGIDKRSLVRSAIELMQRVKAIHEKVHDSALAEEYIEGREFYVGVLGNSQPLAFPPIEMDFSGLPDGSPHILDSRAKWDEKSREFKGTSAVLRDLPDELRARLQKVAVSAYRALRVRDYGRVDLRVTATGEIYVIEVNASCYLEQSSEFAISAAAAGTTYVALVNRIAELALERRGLVLVA